ncbi:putative SNU66/SART1 family protein [Helianthus anomalus]
MDRSDTRRGRSVEARDHDSPPTVGERWKGGYDDVEDDASRDTKHRSKDKSSSSRRRDEKDHRTRDREKSKVSDGSKDREKDSKAVKDRRKEDEYDREKDRARDKDRVRDKDRDKDRDRDRERVKEKEKEKEKERNRDRERGREKVSRKQHDEKDEGRDLGKEVSKSDSEEDGEVKEVSKVYSRSRNDKDEGNVEGDNGGLQQSASEIQDRIMRMKEERLKKKSEEASDVLSWVSKSRKLEEKRNVEREKALYLSKVFEEQDNVNQEEDEDEPSALQHSSRDLAGFKVLDGLDKVIEGGAVVLTLKDQNILADGDINEVVFCWTQIS